MRSVSESLVSGKRPYLQSTKASISCLAFIMVPRLMVQIGGTGTWHGLFRTWYYSTSGSAWVPLPHHPGWTKTNRRFCSGTQLVSFVPVEVVPYENVACWPPNISSTLPFVLLPYSSFCEQQLQARRIRTGIFIKRKRREYNSALLEELAARQGS